MENKAMENKATTTMLLIIFLIAGSSFVWAEELIVPKGNKDISQLHDEIVAAHPELRGALQSSGSFKDPLIRVYESGGKVRIVFPDGLDIRPLISNHVPKQRVDHRPSAKQKLKDLGLTDEEIKEIVR